MRSFQFRFRSSEPWIDSWMSDQNGVVSSAIGTSSQPQAGSMDSRKLGNTANWRHRPPSAAPISTTDEIAWPRVRSSISARVCTTTI